MANSLGRNPIIANAVGTADSIIAAGEVRIQSILYAVGTTAGGSCDLRDGTGGDVIFTAKGAANTTVTLTLIEPLRVSGLWLESIQANGNLLIYTCPSDRPYYP